jgi:hypothetical protein
MKERILGEKKNPSVADISLGHSRGGTTQKGFLNDIPQGHRKSIIPLPHQIILFTSSVESP